jgi:hypothetical protein
MRLRKPSLVPQILPTLTSKPFSNSPLSDLADATVIDPSLDGNGLTGLASLPNGFGSMFVGTTFSAYICLNNEMEEDITTVRITVEIRTSNSKTVLKPSTTRQGANDITTEETFTLKPGEALHQIIKHSPSPPFTQLANKLEVIQRGDHTLEVGVSYLPPSSIHPRTFRKMYNFTTFDTIAIRSMSLPHTNRSVIFQMHIENTGDSPLRLTRVHFHAENAWDVKSCNEIDKNHELGVFESGVLEVRGVYQTMHVLVPVKDGDGEMPFALGRLEIDWVGGMGERGSSITGLMKRRPV